MQEEVIKKFEEVLGKLLSENWAISFFAVIQQADTNRWDIVIGGDNIENAENTKAIAKIISNSLAREELVLFSRLVLLNSTNPFIKNITRSFRVSGRIKIAGSTINNVFLKNAVILYSKATR